MTNQLPQHSNLQFRECGTGPAVLLVHGWMVSGRAWDRLLPALPGYRVVVPDLPGCGETPADPAGTTLDGLVARLAAFCDMLDLDAVRLVGHSMGGQLAMLLAAARPERFASLTLMNPVPVQGLDFPGELQPLFRDCGGDRARIAEIVDMSCNSLDDDGREELIEDGLQTSAETISAGFDAFRNGDPGASLARATLPTTIIATDDPFLPAAFLGPAVVERLPNARLVELSGPGHYPQVEKARETAELLRGLLA